MEESEQYLSEVLRAAARATTALQTLLDGGAADLEALEEAAQLLGVFRSRRVVGYRGETTEDDVAVARHLVDLVRDGAPMVEIVTAARRVRGFLCGPLELDLSDAERVERDTLEMLRARYRVELTEDDMRIVRRHAELLVQSWREPSGVSEELLATMRQIREISVRGSTPDRR